MARVATPLPPSTSPPGAAEATRERLLVAAHELYYERSGANVSVSEVCARARANVAMVKYCFGNKDGLVDALIARITDSFRGDFERLAALQVGWRETLERHIGEVVRNYLRFPYLTRLLTDQYQHAERAGTRATTEAFVVPMAAFHAALLAEGERRGEIRPVDPVLFFFSVVGMAEFVFAARPWMTQGFGIEIDDGLVERYVAHVVEFVIAGIGVRP